MTGLTATRVEPGELAKLARFLDAASLPSADLADPGRLFFRFDADSIVGHAGLEGDGVDRLLRSVVILADHRGHGFGRGMVARLEAQVRDIGVRHLHLLTITAAPFFRTLGYADADRGAAPPAVAASREFTALYPASAAYLVNPL